MKSYLLNKTVEYLKDKYILKTKDEQFIETNATYYAKNITALPRGKD